MMGMSNREVCEMDHGSAIPAWIASQKLGMSVDEIEDTYGIKRFKFVGQNGQGDEVRIDAFDLDELNKAMANTPGSSDPS
jgi:hypothetical protein